MKCYKVNNVNNVKHIKDSPRLIKYRQRTQCVNFVHCCFIQIVCLHNYFSKWNEISKEKIKVQLSAETEAER